jgi:hypothetical protein
LIHSSAYHPQTDGQIERVNQILEDMLRACVMEYMLLVCYVCMEFQRRLSLIEGPSLLLGFGSSYTHPSGLT